MKKLATAGLATCLIGCDSPEDYKPWNYLSHEETGEILRWQNDAQIETHLASVPGGEVCRQQILELLDRVEKDWDLVGSPNSPRFVSDHEERYKAQDFHTRQGGPMWGMGVDVKYGEVVIFAGTRCEIWYAAGDGTGAFFNYANSGTEITGGYVVFAEEDIVDYCNGDSDGTLEHLMYHELGHVVGLGHAKGSKVMKPRTKRGSNIEIPDLHTDGLGISKIYE